MARFRPLIALATMVAVVAAAAGWSGPAAAADRAARVAAVAYHPLPREAAVRVVPYDDSEANLRLKARFEEALAAAGRALGGDGALRLTFETDVSYRGDLGARPSLGRLEAGSGRGVDAEVNIWSNREDSLLGGAAERRPRAGDGARLTLAVRLREGRGGRVLWQGEAVARLVGREAEATAAALVGPLVARLGESRARERVELDVDAAS